MTKTTEVYAKDAEQERHYNQLCRRISCMRISNRTGYCGMHEPIGIALALDATTVPPTPELPSQV